MPDNIAEIDGGAAMIYQGETPWHHLGVKVNGDEPTEQLLKLARLDWEVTVEPMFFVDRNPEINVYRRVPNRRVVLRAGNIALGTVGDTYVPIQNHEALKVLELARQEFGLQIETMGALGKGEKVWALAKMPNHFHVVDGDRISGYTLILWGHDGATPETGRLTPIRVVCQNTLELALHNSRRIFKINHNTAAENKLDEAAELVRDLVKVLTLTGQTFSKMALTPLKGEALQQYIDTVLGIEDGSLVQGVVARRRGAVYELATGKAKGFELAPNTLWTAYNAFTEYVDHIKTAEVVAHNDGDGLRVKKANLAALFGSGAHLKAKALSVAEELVGA